MAEEAYADKKERQEKEMNIKVTIVETGLKAPFAPNKIKWRAADFRGSKSSALLYLDARDVMDRLDEIVGINNWETDYKDLETRCVCKLSIRYDNDFDWVRKSDVGTQSTFEGDKGMYSDALKRAAMTYGTIMEYYEANKTLVSELKEEDAVAAKAVGDSFKHWANVLKGMEKNG